MKNPRELDIQEAGYQYQLPMYKVTNEGIEDSNFVLPINFCKGNKNDETLLRQEGVFVESLLETCVDRLKTVNQGELSTRETAIAITKIEEAVMWLEKRSKDREIRRVQGTYQK